MLAKFFITVLLLFCFWGCSDSEKIEEEKLVKVYADLVIAHDTLKSAEDFSAMKNDIFSRHNITEKDYEKTLDFYADDIERWDGFFEKAIAYMETMKKKEGN